MITVFGDFEKPVELIEFSFVNNTTKNINPIAYDYVDRFGVLRNQTNILYGGTQHTFIGSNPRAYNINIQIILL